MYRTILFVFLIASAGITNAADQLISPRGTASGTLSGITDQGTYYEFDKPLSFSSQGYAMQPVILDASRYFGLPPTDYGNYGYLFYWGRDGVTGLYQRSYDVVKTFPGGTTTATHLFSTNYGNTVTYPTGVFDMTTDGWSDPLGGIGEITATVTTVGETQAMRFIGNGTAESLMREITMTSAADNVLRLSGYITFVTVPAAHSAQPIRIGDSTNASYVLISSLTTGYLGITVDTAAGSVNNFVCDGGDGRPTVSLDAGVKHHYDLRLEGATFTVRVDGVVIATEASTGSGGAMAVDDISTYDELWQGISCRTATGNFDIYDLEVTEEAP